MARFNIIKKNVSGIRAQGYPTYSGVYMSPGVLTFREIVSPSPIDWQVGDFVSYTRTGKTYKLYEQPTAKKQARWGSYGAAYVYTDVQFFDDSKQLDICPFRDLVTGDNRIHFSTQPTISTFENVAGIAARLQACLDDMYGANAWSVLVATTAMGADLDLVALMDEPRQFSVSGVSILGALAKIYEVWPEVGWVYKIVSGLNTIIIGGAGLAATQGEYAYGMGRGLTSLTRSVANAGEIANRIYPYGSSRNMLPSWYKTQPIKDADSVDIANLMIPVSAWGLTDNLPDAAKAYIQDASSITAQGLRPKTVYFDGSGDLKEIYPTIREVTIGEIRAAMQSTDKYYPSSQWADSARADTIRMAFNPTDDGFAGDNGSPTVLIDYHSFPAWSLSETVSASSLVFSANMVTRAVSAPSAGNIDIFASALTEGSINDGGNFDSAVLTMRVTAGGKTFERRVDLERDETTPTLFNLPTVISLMQKGIEVAQGGLIQVTLILTVSRATAGSAVSLTGSMSRCDLTTRLNKYRDTSFFVRIRQIGFDLSEQAALGSGMTLAMRTGDCAGRSFKIIGCTYLSNSDSWELELSRSEDESLGQWFPNSDFEIAAGDEFVLLDIAMPALYMGIAANRLLAAAQEFLADSKVERWQYQPEIDAKFMIENSRVLTPGEYMLVTDNELVGIDVDAKYYLTNQSAYYETSQREKVRLEGDAMPEAVLIDSVTISEGEAAIPTYKVVLRDRKKPKYSDTGGGLEISERPVTQADMQQDSGGGASVSEFFELAPDGESVKLKDEYTGLWTNGFISAGGRN